MSVNKAIFTVEVDDSQFKEFKALFDRYQEAVKALPKDWKEAGAGVVATGEAQHELTGTLKEQVALLVRQELAAREVADHADTTSSRWSTVVGKFKEIDKALERGTVRMAKWGALATGVLGGLSALGIGASLWGLDRMASAVTSYRRTAMGMGVSYGQLQSANVNYSRLISSPSGLLSSVSNAKYDITSPEYATMLGVGVPSSLLAKGNVGDITAKFLELLPALFKGQPKGMWGATAKGYGIDQMMPMNDLIAYLSASPDERKQMIEKQREDARRMDITDDKAKKWADFSTQMDRAMKSVEAVFMTKLAALEPGLEKLSGVVVNVVTAFGNSDTLKGWIDGLASGIEALANYVGSKDFQQDVKNFGIWIGQAAQKIWDFITGFNLISPAKAGNMPSSSVLGQGGEAFRPGDYVSPSGEVIHGGFSGSGGSLGTPMIDHSAPLKGAALEHAAFIREYAEKIGMDPDWAVRWAASEGLNAWTEKNPNAGSYVDRDANGNAFSYGDFQLNIKNGLGVIARHMGIDPARAEDWKKADMFAMDWAMKNGISDWRTDAAYRAVGGRVPRITPRAHVKAPKISIRQNTGNDPVLAHFQMANPTAAL